MSEFKFACSICGQHITCDREKAGSHIECPTCFREIIVPQPPANGDSKFVLTAVEAHARPVPHLPTPEASPNKPSPTREYLLWGSAAAILIGAAAGAYILRDKLFKPAAQQPTVSSMPQPGLATPAPSAPADGPWRFDLENVTAPELPAAGRLAGRSFVCHRATLHGGTLNLRQGPTWPPDVGLTIYLVAERGEDMAGQRISFSPGEKLPRMVMRWKDAQDQPVTQPVTVPYALRLEFGQVISNRVPGKIYCCIADAEKSYVAGTFQAEIRKPTPRKSQRR